MCIRDSLGIIAQFVDKSRGLKQIHIEGLSSNIDLDLNDNGEMLHLDVIDDGSMLHFLSDQTG